MASPDPPAATTYECEECGKTFGRPSTLKRHQCWDDPGALHIEPSERKYECPVCRKGYRRKDHLARHARIHSGTDLTKCEYCGRGFRKDYFPTHMWNCRHRGEAAASQNRVTDNLVASVPPSRSSAEVLPAKSVIQQALSQDMSQYAKPVHFVPYLTSRTGSKGIKGDIERAIRNRDPALLQRYLNITPKGWLVEKHGRALASFGTYKMWQLLSREDLLNLRLHTKKAAEMLWVAAGRGNIDCVRFLLDKGCPVDSPYRSEDCTPLLIAARRGHSDTLRLPLERGAAVNGIEGMAGYTPLIAAVKRGSLACIHILLEHGAKVDSWTSWRAGVSKQWTALTYACAIMKKDLQEVIVCLLDAGADVNLGAPTPLDWALESRSSAIVSLLLEAGANTSHMPDLTISCLAAKALGSYFGYQAYLEPIEKLQLLQQAGCKRAEAALQEIREFQERNQRGDSASRSSAALLRQRELEILNDFDIKCCRAMETTTIARRCSQGDE